MKSLSLVCLTNNKVAVLMAVFGAVLLLLNVLLTEQNKKLKVLASRPDRALEVKPGTALPPLEGVDSNGNRLSVNDGRDSRKTVLLVFSPRCSVCEENLPNWAAIINGLDPESFKIAAISLQALGSKKFATQYGIDRIPILTEIDPKYRVSYNLALTPQTILINSDGRVEKVWTGLPQREDKQDIEKALKVRLP